MSDDEPTHAYHFFEGVAILGVGAYFAGIAAIVLVILAFVLWVLYQIGSGIYDAAVGHPSLTTLIFAGLLGLIILAYVIGWFSTTGYPRLKGWFQ